MVDFNAIFILNGDRSSEETIGNDLFNRAIDIALEFLEVTASKFSSANARIKRLVRNRHFTRKTIEAIESVSRALEFDAIRMHITRLVTATMRNGCRITITHKRRKLLGTFHEINHDVAGIVVQRLEKRCKETARSRIVVHSKREFACAGYINSSHCSPP